MHVFAETADALTFERTRKEQRQFLLGIPITIVGLVFLAFVAYQGGVKSPALFFAVAAGVGVPVMLLIVSLVGGPFALTLYPSSFTYRLRRGFWRTKETTGTCADFKSLRVQAVDGGGRSTLLLCWKERRPPLFLMSGDDRFALERITQRVSARTGIPVEISPRR